MKRTVCIDALKGIAIIAVVLYHLGTHTFGYLGVDVFLVIAGFFTAKSIEKQSYFGLNVLYRYKNFLFNRIYRILPLLILAAVFCLTWGYYFMLPDDYENLAQSVVATDLFANNILASITTRDYWATVNEYKPLMHTWYVGLLMQFYITIPLILMCIRGDNSRKIKLIVLSLIFLLSLLLYLFVENQSEKFYYLPYRLYEFCAGCLVFYLYPTTSESVHKKWYNIAYVVSLVVIILLLFDNNINVSNVLKLLTVVILTSLILYIYPKAEIANTNIFLIRWLAVIGASSYSIYVWHQILLALTRYSFTNELLAFKVYCPLLLLLCVLSYLSYKYIETIPKNKSCILVVVIGWILTMSVSLAIYINAGVVRDIPELGVNKDSAIRGQWASYCDRGYLYDKDFTKEGLLHYYVIGNSYGRDWVNIILESRIAKGVEVSYSTIDTYHDKDSRFEEADIIFISTLGLNRDLVDDIRNRSKSTQKVIIVGEKNFGESNGQIYRRRYSADYHMMCINMADNFEERNIRFKDLYGDSFVDMIEMVLKPDGTVSVFTDDEMFISQDCYHLTEAGARYYANLIDWERFY